MALPPEHINIKRRREEEPVDTLYIQTELHQTKRRFTDFVFKRVQVGGDGQVSGTALAASQTVVSPRSVSSSAVSSTGMAVGAGVGGGAGAGATVPLVRATSPGAEFREEKRIAAARKEAEEKVQQALRSSPVTPTTAAAAAAPKISVPSVSGDQARGSATSGRESPASSTSTPASSPRSVRRFQISRSSTPVNILRSAGGGVQKRRGDGAVAVLVEKLRRKPHSRQASLVADAAAEAAAAGEGMVRGAADGSRAGSAVPEPEPAQPRKRPVVNQAERKWREERKGAISAAKGRIAEALEKEAKARKSNWEDESEQLAKEFEKIALELEGEMETEMDHFPRPAVQTTARPVIPKAPLKFQPRTPNKPRPSAAQVADVQTPVEAMAQEEDDSDGEYVYDTYIRRPLPEATMLTNPLVDLELDQAKWFQKHGIDATRQDIGVIVITQEDEQYWEHFAEDEDEDGWDSEDADSNAENNPANDYPDEDLSWDDEEDDPTALYHKYRTHAVSDDEEFDFDDSVSEGGQRAGHGFGFGFGLDSHVDSDDSLDMDSHGHGYGRM